MKRGAAVGVVVVVVGVILIVVALVVGSGDLQQVRGVIGSEKAPFFSDPAVQKAFKDNGLSVSVDTAGSRSIATTTDLSRYDFAFPAGRQSAQHIDAKLQRARVFPLYEPFQTPLAIGSFRKIADLLRDEGVARPIGGTGGDYWRFDMRRYLDLVARDARWTDLPGNRLGAVYDTDKSILISSTDVRRSNSAALYLAIAAYVANGDRIVAGSDRARDVAGRVAPVFTRQGYAEESSEGPFEDYLLRGIAKTPIVMIYEAQFLARKAADDGSIRPGMVLMYPQPNVLTKHTLVPRTEAGDRVGKLLVEDQQLQRLAAEHGFQPRTHDTLNRHLDTRGVRRPPALSDDIGTPTPQTLERMIRIIARERRGRVAQSQGRGRVSLGRATVAAVSVALAVCGALATSGCGPERLRVLAGSELEDVEPLLEQLEDDTGIRLELELTGTLGGAEKIANGERPAMAWFASSRYLDLLTRGGPRHPAASARTMLSPVIVGVKQSVAEEFGWREGVSVSWRDVAAMSRAHRFRFAMTNPAASNSGFSGLVGAASAFADTGKALTSADIDVPSLKGFFEGQKATAGSSGFLAETYLRKQDDLDGIVNYESVLKRINASRDLHEKLVLVYPRDGILTADYPLLLIDPAHREAWEKVRDWLRSERVQQQLERVTRRRSILKPAPSDHVELPFPASAEVVDALLDKFFGEIRAPAHTIFALDLSKSMKDEHRLEDLQAALRNLSGADTSLTGRYVRFRRRERITLIRFRNDVTKLADVVVDTDDDDSPDLARLRARVRDFKADGGTALYAAAIAAYKVAAEQQARDTGYTTTIILMADGGNNQPPEHVEDFLKAIPRSVRDVRMFVIKLGSEPAPDLERMAAAHGGRVFDATRGGLVEAFKESRGYQ